ncbi:MAG: mercuric reductase [Ignavibacteriae bacterium]|nr:MAG: mercuric reductase [Ignavibacteriota bacterium]
MPEKFNAIIIGTGQAAKPLALTFAEKEWKTAVIESKHFGGSCINYGCTPTKSMIASAKIANTVRHSAEYGIRTSSVRVDIKKVIDRKNKIVRSFRDSGKNAIEKQDCIDLIFGTASFIDNYTVKVISKNSEERILSAEKIFINTGVSPNIPQIEGLNEINYYTSESLMEVNKVPEHLIIIGGGYKGLEFGQMFRRFGSKISIIQKGNKLLKREDDDITDEIYNILTDEGIKIYLNADTQNVKDIKKGLRLEIRIEKNTMKLKGSHLLITTGVKPNTESLSLTSTDIETDDKGFINVNDELETNIEGVYALGDVKGGPAFTHISYDDYRIIKANLFEGKKRRIKGRLVPYTVFTDPQLGRVGISESEAIQKGFNYRILKMPVSHIARAIETGETRGFMKVIVDDDTKQILGCAVLGAEGGEIMSMIEIAMIAKLPYTELQKVIFAHPLLAESLNSLFSQ